MHIVFDSAHYFIILSSNIVKSNEGIFRKHKAKGWVSSHVEQKDGTLNGGINIIAWKFMEAKYIRYILQKKSTFATN